MMNTKETPSGFCRASTRRLLTFAGASLLASAFGQTSYALPTIGIEGLAGAEHWVWIEGVNYASGSGGTTFRGNNGVSGWMDAGPANSYNRTTGSSNVGTVEWNVYTPAAMSAETKVYARARVNTTAGMSVQVNGNTVSPANTQIVSSGLQNPTQFLGWQQDDGESTTPLGQGIGLGALNGEDTYNIRFSAATYASSGLNSFMVNGILIYDGDPALRSVADNGTGRVWLRNPGSLSSPVLEGIVTPIFDIGGLEDGNIVQYFLNGDAYTPGTAIGAGEDYELVVAIYASGDVNSQRIAFAGANFSVIPEPGTYALVLAGVVAALVVLRRRRA